MNDEHFHIVRRDFLTLTNYFKSISESLIVLTGIQEDIAQNIYKLTKLYDKSRMLNEKKVRSRKKDKKSDA